MVRLTVYLLVVRSPFSDKNSSKNVASNEAKQPHKFSAFHGFQNRKRSVLTIDSLYLPCYIQNNPVFKQVHSSKICTHNDYEYKYPYNNHIFVEILSSLKSTSPQLKRSAVSFNKLYGNCEESSTLVACCCSDYKFCENISSYMQ